MKASQESSGRKTTISTAIMLLVVGLVLIGCPSPTDPGSEDSTVQAGGNGGNGTEDNVSVDSGSGNGGTADDGIVPEPTGTFDLTPRLEMRINNDWEQFEPNGQDPAEPIDFLADVDLGITLLGLTTPQNLNTAAGVEWQVIEGEDYISLRLLEPKSGIPGFEFIATPIPDTRAAGTAEDRTVVLLARVVDPLSPETEAISNYFTIRIPADPSPAGLPDSGSIRYRFVVPPGLSPSGYSITLAPVGGGTTETVSGSFSFPDEDNDFYRDYVPEFDPEGDMDLPFGRYLVQAEIDFTDGTESISIGSLNAEDADAIRIWAFPNFMWYDVNGDDSWAVFEIPEPEPEEPGAVAYAIGDTGPAGGIIFFMRNPPEPDSEDPDRSWRYMEAAPRNWHASGNSDPRFVFNVSNGPNVYTAFASIGGGKINTATIRDQLEAVGSSARTVMHAARAADQARVTHGGTSFEDWFLPTRDELSRLWEASVDFPDKADLLGGWYWTSSASNNGERAVAVSMTDGRRYVIYQDTDNFVPRVRPVRRF
ncbi:Lcl C-terminal domain-containing protein [Spirochaeta dissipatitropha]